jgi:hypothetical protein
MKYVNEHALTGSDLQAVFWKGLGGVLAGYDGVLLRKTSGGGYRGARAFTTFRCDMSAQPASQPASRTTASARGVCLSVLGVF